MSANDVILRIDRLNKSFGTNHVLKDATLELRRGELKVLIGPSGGGKSTLLQCMNFLLPPDSGRIWLDGNEIKFKNKRELYAYRQAVGMIFQDFNLFDHLSAMENVRIALTKVKGIPKKAATERAMAELERVGMAGKAALYPAQLSGGQKQRVSVARALAMDPKVLLLDEPTSALDPELIGEVLTVIKDLAKSGMTMVMATHQITFSAQLASEFIFMEQGCIIEHDTPAVLLAESANSRTKDFCAKINELGESA
ncbi:MAG: amino acid ABC transporter ATP-binding protein [Proteobacteria bacterium]|nr:amino acid ABC transporter ATP-binding protein [Pseudomonadota bacterium]